MAALLQGKIVVDLRAKVYDKLQRLSFRFFDENATGSIINRVTGDVQSVRMFVDGVVIQVIILAISLAIYLAYMLTINVKLTVACLATTPLLYIVARIYSKVVQPAYRKERDLFDNLILGLSESIQGTDLMKMGPALGHIMDPALRLRQNIQGGKGFLQCLFLEA